MKYVDNKVILIFLLIFSSISAFFYYFGIGFILSYLYILRDSLRFDLGIVLFYFILYLFLLLKNKTLLFYLNLSTFISLLWISFSNSIYGYNRNLIRLFGINLFPLFSFASGLFSVYFLYGFIQKKFNKSNFMLKFLGFFAFYSFFLILAETIGYHVLNIRNASTAIYSGLAICNCMHAPVWMQISYFGLSIVYYLVCNLFIKYKLIKAL